MLALSEVEREVYISQEWLDSVTTALSNVLSWRIIKLWKKQQQKRQFIAYAFFALLGWEIAIVLLLQSEVCNVQALGFSGFQEARGVAAHHQS